MTHNRCGMRRALILAALLLAGLTTSGCDAPAEAAGPSEATTAAAADSAESSERTSSYGAYLDILAELAGLDDPPEVETIRVLQDGHEQTQLVWECLADAGFPRDPEDGSFAYTEDQLPTFQLMMYTCNAQYRLDERLYEPLTESQILFVREFWIESTIPCLSDRGYEVPGPPSAQTVIATWNTVDSYYPHESLDLNLPMAELEALQIDCPMMPPAVEIWER